MANSKPATKYFSGPIFNPDFRALRDNVGKWTASESFTVDINDASSSIPAVGDPCKFPGFESLLANEVEIRNIEGDLVEIKTTYGGFDDAEFQFSESDPDAYDYELSIQVVEEPLFTNPRFQFPEQFNGQPLKPCEKVFIRDFLAGLLKIKEPEDCDTPYDPDADVELIKVADDTVVTPKITTDTGKLFFQLALQGIESYYSTRQVWRETYTAKERPTSAELNGVGKIVEDDPVGAPTVANNRNWLLNGLSVSTAKKNVYTITKEYILSDIGGWDENLYQRL